MSNEIKITLKEARENFKENKFADVIKKCKKVLKKDRDNYGALILLAAAMKETEEYKLQVPLVLQKATQIQTHNPLAWQCLIAYCEKNLDSEDSYNKIIIAYCKLLQLDSDSKFTSILDKILEYSSQIKDVTVLEQCVEHLNELRERIDDDRVKMIDKTLGQILMDNFNNLNKYQDLLKSVFKSVINRANKVDQQNFYEKYLKLLYYKNEFITLIKEAVNMHKQFPQDKLPLEYVCRVYCEKSMMDVVVTDIDITQFYEPLLNTYKESEVGSIAKALHLKKMDNLIAAREILKDVLALKPCSLYGWMALSEISMKLYCWEDAEIAARRALEIKEYPVKNKLLYKMDLTIIESMSRSDDSTKWRTALRMCEQLLTIHPTSQLKLIYARINVLLNESDDIHSILSELESESETKLQANTLRALHLKQNKQFDEALHVLGSALESSEAWLLLGTIYWEMSEYSHSLMAFLNGIKADRHNWKCLVYLGHYYREYGNDMERSRRCYQTALQINPNSEDAGIGLSTAYRLLKNQDANIKLLQTLTTQDSGPKWAWLQLGLQYLDQGNAMQAIVAFQHVIRADPNDNHCWESLADAYFIRGAHTSALKSYQKALELCPGSLYPMMQLANIKLIIGQYKEAKNDFEHILTNDTCYIPALKGLAETCLALAKEYTAKQLLGRASSYLQQAMDSLTITMKQRNDISCLWKLLGDVCCRAAMLPEEYSHLKVSSILIKYKETEEIILFQRHDLFSLSIRCYCCALSLSSQSALLWHDLALCYLRQLQYHPLDTQKNLASKCLAAAKYAVKLCPSVWLHWNLLGVICMSPYIKNYALAQHAYIMAIDKELNNAVVWSNLGTLYLHIGNLYKANEAYSQAQRADPAYINSWVGQALIAELMNRKEAMDLFRHATQLGYHDQAAIGYAYWVLNVILKSDIKKDALHTYIIGNMHAISVAADVMTWYIEYHPNDCTARNVYGLILERQKLYKSATEQFAAALCTSVNEEKDLVCINLARMLLRLKKYNEAIKLCESVTKPNYNSQCHLALALFKAARYEESYTAYETTLQQFADTETEKSYILRAMAAIAYTFERIHDAKTLLFQCIQIHPPAIMSLLAVASLGILHGDANLTTLVLKELKTYECHPEYGYHVVNLSACFYLFGNDVQSAVATLSKAIVMYPNDVKYSIRLLKILLEVDFQMFSKCAKKLSFLSKNTAIDNIAQVACTLAISSFIQDIPMGIRLIQKVLFTYPGRIESWATFIAAFLPRSANRSYDIDNEWLLKFVILAQQNCQPTSLMAKWLRDSAEKLKQLN